MKKVLQILGSIILTSVTSTGVFACGGTEKPVQNPKAKFNKISKIEIKKTYNNKFQIRFYKTNVDEKEVADDFWFLTDDGKYLAEFDITDNDAKTQIMNTLRIKDSDYYVDFTILNGWDLSTVELEYKINNNEKELIQFNAKSVADISILLKQGPTILYKEIDQGWIDLSDRNNPKFTQKWWDYVNYTLYDEINNSFISYVKKYINLDIKTNIDFTSKVVQWPYNVQADITDKILSFVISTDILGQNQLENKLNYEIIINNTK